MSKILPFFPFYPAEWDSGDISLESYEVQGVFIALCSYYWIQDCEIYLPKAIKKLRNGSDSLNILIDENIIGIADDGRIIINFLDHLREKFAKKAIRSRKNGSLGGRPKHEITQKKPTTNPEITQGLEDNNPEINSGIIENNPEVIKNNLIKRREEERIEENRIEEKKKVASIANKLFEEFWKIYPPRNGRKGHKANTKALFIKIKLSEMQRVVQNAINYGIGNSYPKDSENFLKKGFWESWDKAAEPSSQTPKNSDQRTNVAVPYIPPPKTEFTQPLPYAHLLIPDTEVDV